MLCWTHKSPIACSSSRVKTFPMGFVGGVENDHAGVVVDSGLQLVHVDGPVTSGSGLSGTLLRGMEGHVDNLTTRHLNVVDVLIEERAQRQ